MGSSGNTVIPDFSWMEQRVDRVPNGNKFYQILCWIMFKRQKKLRYTDIYFIIYGLNKGVMGDEKAKEIALKQILKIYKFLHNNKLPKGIE